MILPMIISRCLVVLMLAATTCCSKSGNPDPVPPQVSDSTFVNPLLSSGPDPYVIRRDSMYYYTHTFGNRVVVFKTRYMSQLKNAPATTIWSAPASGDYSRDIWAPEIHYLQGKWYCYFAADNGENRTHRIYALENASPDPTAGSWTFKGKVTDTTDRWAIDATMLEYNGQLYMLWSGWEGTTDVRQDIYIAKMNDPLTVGSARVRISMPDYEWEKIGSPDVNEGPSPLISPSGQLFVTYSASGCWTDDYSLGLLTLKPEGDPMNPADWQKSTEPVFSKKPENGAYAPGHNSFFKSVDGKEWWILYHANTQAGQGCGDVRNPRMQSFTWNADGTPNFGQPVRVNAKLKKPSGEL